MLEHSGPSCSCCSASRSFTCCSQFHPLFYCIYQKTHGARQRKLLVRCTPPPPLPGLPARPNKSASKSSHSSFLQLSLISLSADEGTDCSRARHEMEVACVSNQNCFTIFTKARSLASVESLSRRGSQPPAEGRVS